MELLVAGGDRRHELLCELARRRGWHVMSMGLPMSGVCVGVADAAVLPMPYAREGYITAPLVREAPRIEDIVPHLRAGDDSPDMIDEEKSAYCVTLEYSALCSA